MRCPRRSASTKSGSGSDFRQPDGRRLVLAFMPRQQRLVVPEVPLHIIQRGNDRMACFRQDRDYLVYLALLQKASENFGCAVHAYCLMTNHIHLLLTPGSSDACAALMHGLAHRYAQYFNREHKRTGTLWDGRYRSCISVVELRGEFGRSNGSASFTARRICSACSCCLRWPG